MAKKMKMGHRDVLRCQIMEMVTEGKLLLKEAAERLGISKSQAIRLKARYIAQGMEGLVHKRTGQESARKIDSGLREKVLSVYHEKYPDFGPTFAVEKLEENEGIKISRETLRQWLIDDKQWKRRRKHNKHRSRRERRPCFGDMIQMDGSPHDWFEGRRTPCCLMNLVDDAKGTTLHRLFEEETTEAVMYMLWAWIKRFGIPKSVYCDRKNAYVIDREPTKAELLAGITKPKSHFEKACDKLGIQVIVAKSPQGKGRVERNHGVHQDRLVKELRLANISTIEDANKFIDEVYIPKINALFEKTPACPDDGHVPLLGLDLREIFVFEYERTVSLDWVVQFKTHLFQILKENRNRPQPGNKVTVRIRLDKTLDIYWQGKKLLTKEITKNGEPKTILSKEYDD